MSRGTLMSLLAVDLLVMAASGYVLMSRVRTHWNDTAPAPLVAATPAPAPVAPQPALPAAAAKPAATAPAAAPSQPQNSEETSAQEPSKPGASSSEKRILFKYRDAQAQKVAISGEFSRWTPKPMKKDKNGNWTLVFRLKPGEYAYNFIVDGKLIRDPANRRMKPSGQKIPSSVLTVQP